MALHSVLYVSHSRIRMPTEAWRANDIVDYSRWWNPQVQITGALLFTEDHFAQYIEGPHLAVSDLFTKLRQDERHKNIEIPSEGERDDRRFKNWDLAYFGPESLLASELRQPFDRASALPHDVRADRLVSLMLSFTDQSSRRLSYADGGLRF